VKVQCDSHYLSEQIFCCILLMHQLQPQEKVVYIDVLLASLAFVHFASVCSHSSEKSHISEHPHHLDTCTCRAYLTHTAQQLSVEPTLYNDNTMVGTVFDCKSTCPQSPSWQSPSTHRSFYSNLYAIGEKEHL
jgi:hypothetical protein